MNARSASVPDSLAQLIEESCGGRPDHGVDRRRFAGWLSERLAGSSDPIAAARRLHLGDMFLAFAVAQGAPGALRELERILSEARSTIRPYDRTGDLADEVMQDLRAKLFMAEPGKAHQILSYQGRGALRSWLRSAAVHLALMKLRTMRRGPPIAEHEAALELVSHDLELTAVKLTYRAEFATAFQEALAELGPRERNLLRMHLIDRLSIDRVGALHQVNRTTAFRWIVAARNELVARTRAALRRRLVLSEDEVSSAIRLVRSQLELSVRSALGRGSSPRA